MRVWVSTVSFALICVGTVGAQNNVGSIAGKVLDEKSLPVEATVIASAHSIRRSTFTLPDGSFRLSNLPAGTYVMCAQPMGVSLRREDGPVIDSCMWQDRSSLAIALPPGQNRTNVTVPMQHGYLLKVRVNDPAKIVAAALGNIAGSDLSITVAGPSGLPKQLRIIADDATGRDHGIVIPFNVPHKLFIRSARFALTDAGGRNIDGRTPVDILVSPGATPPVLAVNVGSAPAP